MPTPSSSPRAVCAVVLAATLFASAPRVAQAAGASPGVATAVQREQAQARFVRGRQLYAAKKFDEALVEFRASLDIVASPNTRLYAARCLRELGRLVDAYAELGRTIVEANEHARDDARYVKAASGAAEERAEIASQLGFITVQVDHATPTTTLKVGGEDVKRAAWSEPLPVMPGGTELSLETPGLPPVERRVNVAAGETQPVSLDAGMAPGAPPPPPIAEAPPSPETPTSRTNLRPYAYVAGGVGVAGLVTFAVAGSMAKARFDDLTRTCGGPCPADRAGDVSSGRTSQAVANVGLVAGLAFIATGATLFLLSLTSSDHAQTALIVKPNWVGIGGTL